MNRRQALGAIAAIVPAASVAPSAEPRKFGRLTIDSHRQHKALTGEVLHVWLDGEDVTRLCAYADDVEGVVCLFCLGRDDEPMYRRMLAKGGLHMGDRYLEVRGRVAIAPGADI